VKNENRPVEWAALGKEEAINWEEDHFQDTASHPQAESPTCPFCGVPLSEPDNLEDHEDWCRDNQRCSCWICGGAA
jgi:hypothetical protein